jgi:uncharacterized protein YecE (DUF72 family)
MIYVGTCGFSESIKKYFSDFNTVEIQQTFYKILDVKLLHKWRKMAKEDFIFNFKVFQGITHPYTSRTWKRSNIDVSKFKEKVGYLKPTKEVFEFWNKMVEYAEILKTKVIVIQLPESFKNIKENWENAEKFFRNIERKDFEIGVELRGWSEDDIKKFCNKFDVIDVCDLNQRLPTITRKISYFRLHGSYKNGKINYYHQYNDDEMREMKEKIKKLKSKEIFAYFNNVFMLNDSKRFIQLIHDFQKSH